MFISLGRDLLPLLPFLDFDLDFESLSLDGHISEPPIVRCGPL